MVEYEKKVPLCVEEYECLKQLQTEHKKIVEQINYYYDTNDFAMNKQGITCRVRGKNGKYIATIKKHDLNNPEYSIETSREAISEYDYSLFECKGIILQGFLRTERIFLVIKDKYNIVIDKNTYLGYSDYELEIEYTLESADYVNEILWGIVNALRNAGLELKYCEFIERSKSAKSKSTRFFEKLKNIKAEKEGNI